MAQSRPGSFGVQDKSNGDRPSSELDIWDKAITATTDDEFLDSVNLGLGNYSNREFWQQVQSFRDGLYADAAFARLIVERAIVETKYALGRDGFAYYDEQTDKVKQWAAWDDLDDEEKAETDLVTHGEEIWSDLAEKRKFEALGAHSGITRDWRPPHWRMLMMRNDASRSRGARLLDNLFGRVTEVNSDVSSAAEEQLMKLGGE